MKRGNTHINHLCKLLVLPAVVATFVLFQNVDLSISKAILNTEYNNFSIYNTLIDAFLNVLLVWSIVIVHKHFRRIIYYYYFIALMFLFQTSGELYVSFQVVEYKVNLHDSEEGLDVAFNAYFFCFAYLFVLSAIFDVYFKKVTLKEIQLKNNT